MQKAAGQHYAFLTTIKRKSVASYTTHPPPPLQFTHGVALNYQANCTFHYIIYISYHITQGVPPLVDITAGGDFLGLCDQKSSYKHVSDFGQLRSYGRLKLRIEG